MAGSEVANLWTFLRKRGLPEHNIFKMKQDKVDAVVIRELNDESLAVYIPVYGDRIATRHFCIESQKKDGTDAKRQSLLEKLRQKMGIGKRTIENEDADSEDSMEPAHIRKHMRNNKAAVKKTRKVEIGWVHEGKQVRKRSGGGTRILDLSKEAKKADILHHAKDLFFPNGISKKGKWEIFSHDIVDYQESELDDDVTIGELYSVLKMGILRFYLNTRFLTDEDESESDIISKADKHADVRAAEEECSEPIFVISSVVETSDVSYLSNSSEVTIGPFLGEPSACQLDDTLLHDPGHLNEEKDPDVIITDILQPTDDIIHAWTSSGETEHPPWNHSVDSAVLSNADYEVLNVGIRLHRATLLEEMISQFKDPAILSHPLTYSFIDEKGADADGVSRDVYSAFWSEFLDCSAEGEEMRVPSLCPKYQEEEWRSIGRILAKGFKDHGYFPTRLAQAFTVALVFGEHSVSSHQLYESLLLYLSHTERDLVLKALKEDLIGDDKDELMDLMDHMGVTTVPTQNNLKSILLQVAHKQIIQQPKYALDNMSEVSQQIFRETFTSAQEIEKMYEEKKPTTRKLLKLLDASPSTQAENQSLRFLQQYIRGLDGVGLRKMLRFMTGSDVLCVEKIEILFTPLDGLSRRLVAHTCGPVLELPCTYNSYPELRAEMESILSNKNVYIMDIV
ncbi:uncharacterized protein LOC143528391 [Brachyhypopomus gauderio]|uniref:uncharacterized protein LOC143528391 n=1 Tax=Brachyhypopomus gauderio TaxID=698409 RepID=UPI0040435FC5